MKNPDEVKNPNAPYPGRQLFLGYSAGSPAFAYLVTGRSPASRERRAVVRDNTVIMGPIGNTPYDELRHYTAVKYDNASGVLAVTNGIQTEAIYEAYRLLFNVKTPADASYIEKLMEGARSEPDSLNTPRIAGVFTRTEKGNCFIEVIKRHDMPSKSFTFEPTNMFGISTYEGEIENPKPYIPSRMVRLEGRAQTATELAQYLYDISAETYNGDDIRVCAVGGLYRSGKWEIAVINRFNG